MITDDHQYRNHWKINLVESIFEIPKCQAGCEIKSDSMLRTVNSRSILTKGIKKRETGKSKCLQLQDLINLTGAATD